MPRKHIPMHIRGNRRIGHVTIMERKKKTAAPPCACGQPQDYLCDGDTIGGATCDRPLCARCAVSIRALDKEYCSPHASGAHASASVCILRGTPGLVPCGGVLVESDFLCVRHEVFFDEWVGHHGGEAIYKDKRIPQEERRRHFVTWLANASAELVVRIATRRHLPTT